MVDLSSNKKPSKPMYGRKVSSVKPATKKYLFPSTKFESTPNVSVIIPCYNYAKYVAAAVDSALDQLGVHVEVLIVDDCSTDDSLAVVRQMAAKDERVRVIHRKENGGPVAAFNQGLSEATGKYLVRLDADDLLTPSSLLRAVAVAEEFPNVGLVYGHPLHFTGTQLPQPRTAPRTVTVWTGGKWLWDRCRTGQNVITSPEVLMRASIIRKVGGQANLAHTHDMEHWLRISAFCDVAYIHGADQAWHREHPQSLSSREVTGPIDLEQRWLAFGRLFDEWGATIDPEQVLQKMARKAVGRSADEAAIHALDAGLSWEETFLPYRKLAVEMNPESAIKLSVTRRYHAQNNPLCKGRSLLRRSKRGVRHRVSMWRWHRSGVF